MSKLIDLTGQRFNSLVVIRKVGNDKHRKTIWLCQCDCGNLKEISRERLMSGQKTCGVCVWINKRQGVIPLENKLIERSKRQAKDRGYSWELFDEDVRNISKRPCNYCGNVDKRKNDSTGEMFFMNGIDRVDNSKGYTKENVVPCCKRCNTAKNNMKYDEFVSWILSVYTKVFTKEN